MAAYRQPRAEQALDEVLPLVRDIDEEVRVAAVTVLGDARYRLATGRLIGVLTDDRPRVRCAAALALSRLGASEAVDELVTLLIANADQDATIRHAAALGLKACATPNMLRALAAHPNRSARLGAVLALRMLRSPSLAVFLSDQDAQIQEEAARAIHDLTLKQGLPQLADLIHDTKSSEEMFLRRILAANFRLGGKRQAAALVAFAADESRPKSPRVDALTLLGNWEDPPDRDFVTGLWRPLAGRRDEGDVREPLTESLLSLLGSDYEIRLATARLAASLKVEESRDELLRVLHDQQLDGEERANALLGLANFEFAERDEMIRQEIEDGDPYVRAAAQDVADPL